MSGRVMKWHEAVRLCEQREQRDRRVVAEREIWNLLDVGRVTMAGANRAYDLLHTRMVKRAKAVADRLGCAPLVLDERAP